MRGELAGPGRRAKAAWRATLHSWPKVAGQRSLDSAEFFMVRARLVHDRSRIVEIPIAANQLRAMLADGAAWLEAKPFEEEESSG